MSVTAEFQAMMNRAWNVIDAALANEVGEAAKDVLQETIYQNVYSYQPSVWAEMKRRYDSGGLGDRNNMIASVNDVGTAGRTHELQVQTFAGLQDYGPNFRGGFIGIGPSMPTGGLGHLDEIVETGDPSYRQPGPRPFYADAEKMLVNSGIVEGELAAALLRAGFEIY